MTDIDTEITDDEVEALSFGAAMQELEGILRRVESEETDIDELADELKRAALLLETCRAKIRRAEVEVSQIVQTLERPAQSEPPAPEASGAPDEGASDQVASDESPSAGIGETASLFETGD